MQLKSDNSKTLDSYEDHVAEYVSGTSPVPSDNVTGWYQRLLSNLPKDSRILEIGSAFARDAEYVESLGYKVQCTDATQDFVRLMKEKGHDAYLLNVLTDDLGSDWDVIFANCVFLHFTEAEFKLVLNKIKKALRPGGILGFAVKRGEGSKWSEEKIGAPRYFQYWQQEGLRQLVDDVGLKIIDIRDGVPESADQDKIYVIATKS